MGCHWCTSDKGGGRGSAGGKETKREGAPGAGRLGRSARLPGEALASWTEGGRLGQREEGQLDTQRSRRQWQSPGTGHGAPGAAGARRGLTAGLLVHRGSYRAPRWRRGCGGCRASRFCTPRGRKVGWCQSAAPPAACPWFLKTFMTFLLFICWACWWAVLPPAPPPWAAALLQGRGSAVHLSLSLAVNVSVRLVAPGWPVRLLG